MKRFHYLKPFLCLMLPAVLLLAGCGSTANVQPALDSAQRLNTVWEHHTAANETVFRSGNPSQAALDAYLLQVGKDREAWRQQFGAHVQFIASIGAMTPEQVQALLDQLTNSAIRIIEADDGD